MPIILESASLPTITVGDIINRAYKILGDTSNSEALTLDQASDGLEALNALLDSFSIAKSMIYVISQEVLTWPSGTTSRTIGPSGNFDTVRPNRVETGTYFQDANAIAYPVDIIQNREVYDNIFDKTVTSSYPDILFYEPLQTLGKLFVYPVPNQSLEFHLNTWKPLTEFIALSTTFTYPPGYRRMLAYNLAKELEPESGLILLPSALRIANKSIAMVKRHNSLPIMSQTETAYVLSGARRPDIVAGQ